MSVETLVATAVEKAKREHAKSQKAASATSWGSLLSFAGLAPKHDEPPHELLVQAFVSELAVLKREQLLAVVPPPEMERRRAYVAAAVQVAQTLVAEAGLEADELFDRCNVMYASLSKTPQTLVEHAKLMIEWMEWRLVHEHLYDTALFYVVEAEYQLHDAKSAGVLSGPSEATVLLADRALEKAGPLKLRIIERTHRDVERLSEEVARQGERLAALAECERRIEAKINNV